MLQLVSGHLPIHPTLPLTGTRVSDSQDGERLGSPAGSGVTTTVLSTEGLYFLPSRLLVFF